jgi:DNA invertase Pin-like site-specific DNA recombinase
MSATVPYRVALYARVSTVDKGQDPELQLGPLREYATGRGWDLTEYVDVAAAGDLRRRTAWRQLLTDATRHRIDLVLVWKLDRAFRSSAHAHTTLAEWEHQGVGFASITQQFDTTSPSGRLIFAVLAAVSEMERSLIAERVKEGMRNAAAKGAKIGRPQVTDRPAFIRKWPTIRGQVLAGDLSRRQAAQQLKVGQATLKRLLDAEALCMNVLESDRSGSCADR